VADWQNSICIVSVLRLVIVHNAAEKGNITSELLDLHANLTANTTTPESGTHALIWSTVEVNTAIICVSVLVMKPLFLRLIPTLINDSQPTTAREDATDFCRVLADVGLSGSEWDPWAWKRNGCRGQRLEEGLRVCVDNESDGESGEDAGDVRGGDTGASDERCGNSLQRGDSCVDDGLTESKRVTKGSSRGVDVERQ
jgi:hypothetical protein